MQRFDDWPDRLAAYLTERSEMEFEWGVHDCCLFAASGVEAITGFDPAGVHFRPRGKRARYKTRIGAINAMRKFAGVDKGATPDELIAWTAVEIAEIAGMPEINPAYAGRGDVALVSVETKTGKALALGIVDGARVLVPAFNVPGLGEVRLNEVRRAWKTP